MPNTWISVFMFPNAQVSTKVAEELHSLSDLLPLDDFVLPLKASSELILWMTYKGEGDKASNLGSEIAMVSPGSPSGLTLNLAFDRATATGLIALLEIVHKYRGKWQYLTPAEGARALAAVHLAQTKGIGISDDIRKIPGV